MTVARSILPPAVLPRVPSVSIENIASDTIAILAYVYEWRGDPYIQSFLLLSSGDSSNSDFPNKMAQLAAICKIELDQEST